jgi:hypothetical protein
MKDENQTSTIDERRQKDLFHVENEEKIGLFGRFQWQD